MWVVGVFGLAACVALCCLTTPHNGETMFPLTVGASVLAGWIVIFLSHTSYQSARAWARHTELMLTGPRESFSGRFEILDGVYYVKNGVSIRKVRLREDMHELLLSVSAKKTEMLPQAFAGTVETVYDCVVAFGEENHEE